MELIKQHVLIVDDNLKNLQITAKFLKSEGYQISLAQDGLGAILLLQTQTPDIILLDIMMPEMDGLEVCRVIKKENKLKDIPIIFLTAKNQSDDLVAGFKAGGVDYITKPFNRNELLMRVKNHIELADSRKKIIEMNKNRDKLYSILAHDIRSPLSSISMMISAFNDKIIVPNTELFNDIMLEISNSTKNTLILLENLLKWTKIQSETIIIAPNQNYIYPIIYECVQLLNGNAKSKNINIEIQVEQEINAYFDELTINAVFRNILSNAIKFTHENGTIIISSKTLQTTVEISFLDNGIGMTEAVINKIFVKDEHYTSLGTKHERGSGLGLYMVKDFIKNNQGQISVSSKVGEGSQFVISLPLTQK